MITAEQIPDEAWRATGLPELAARAVIAAALNAWPRAMLIPYAHLGESDCLRLPLPQEQNND
jgi:hypothetical protein